MKKCVVLGGSGLIGQQFLRMLDNHPNFELVGAFASKNSTGKTIGSLWDLPFFDCPENLENLQLKNLDDLDTNEFDIAFSGLPAQIANDLEIDLRTKGIGVFSNTSSHRMDSDVPILIPEINSPQVELIKIQQEESGNGGFIVTNANCSATGAAIYLAELTKLVKIKGIGITTYQALSGAGKRGISSLEISNNVIPLIKNEEEKLRIETKKILGTFENGTITPGNYKIWTNCARVNVVDGHLEAISAQVDESESPDADDLIESLSKITSPFDLTKYYSAPKTHLKYLTQEDRPQPAKDVFYGDRQQTKGMVVTAGRLRIQEDMVSAFILVHNTIRGGAGGSILNAEYLLNSGLI